MIEIDKNIPIPKKLKRGKKAKYPYENMKVGDSFFSPVSYSSLLSAIHGWKKRNNHNDWEFTCRKEGEGSRIWRIK